MVAHMTADILRAVDGLTGGWDLMHREGWVQRAVQGAGARGWEWSGTGGAGLMRRPGVWFRTSERRNARSVLRGACVRLGALGMALRRGATCSTARDREEGRCEAAQAVAPDD